MARLTTQRAWGGQADAKERAGKRKCHPEHGPKLDRPAGGFSWTNRYDSAHQLFSSYNEGRTPGGGGGGLPPGGGGTGKY